MKSGKRFRIISITLGIVFFLFAAIIALSVFLFSVGYKGDARFILKMGSVLLSAYKFSSFLIPLILFYAAVLLFIPGWSYSSKTVIAGSPLFFLTCVSGERLIYFLLPLIKNQTLRSFAGLSILLCTALFVLLEILLLLMAEERMHKNGNTAEMEDGDIIAGEYYGYGEMSAGTDEAENMELKEACAGINGDVPAKDFSYQENAGNPPEEELPVNGSETVAGIAESGETHLQGDKENAAQTFQKRKEEFLAGFYKKYGADFGTHSGGDGSVFSFGVLKRDERECPEPGGTQPDGVESSDFRLEEKLSAAELEAVRTLTGTAEENAAEESVEEIASAEDEMPEAFEVLEEAKESGCAGQPDEEKRDGASPQIEEDGFNADDASAVGEEEFEEDIRLPGTGEDNGAGAFDGNYLAEGEAADEEYNADGVEDYGEESEDEDFYEDSEEDEEQNFAVNAQENGIEITAAQPLAPAAVQPQQGGYKVPFDLLTEYPGNEYWIINDSTRRSAYALKNTLSEFKINVEITGIRKGPVVTMFEVLPPPGIRLGKITSLQDNIALRLAAESVRIVAPIPGKQAVGIEIPNEERSIVGFRELIQAEIPQTKKMAIPIILGKDITGEPQTLDLAQTPHLLIAGATGSGKSVCVNSIILSILYNSRPSEVKLLLVDPKIVELKLYNDIGHLLTPVITEPKKAFQALQYCICEMERRYAFLDNMSVRDIKSYNRKIKAEKLAMERLPYIVIIIDEFADLMATTGKELEATVSRLCAMSRAVGIHLVLATQRPSTDVITGLIKANIPSRIAFMVASRIDSRIILDDGGAEKLLGKGDMLYVSPSRPWPTRIQGAFVSEEEVEKVVNCVKQFGEPEYIDDEIFIDDDDEIQTSLFGGETDPLYDEALDIVLAEGKASASYIQRKLKIGYNRAARIVEEMESKGVVGPANGSKPRDVIYTP